MKVSFLCIELLIANSIGAVFGSEDSSESACNPVIPNEAKQHVQEVIGCGSTSLCIDACENYYMNQDNKETCAVHCHFVLDDGQAGYFGQLCQLFSGTPACELTLGSSSHLSVDVDPITGNSTKREAVFDSDLNVPRCYGIASSCDSGSLLNSRGSSMIPNEPNSPNTLDSCPDGKKFICLLQVLSLLSRNKTWTKRSYFILTGNVGYYHYFESLDAIIVRSGDVDGSGSDAPLTVGSKATIIAKGESQCY